MAKADTAPRFDVLSLFRIDGNVALVTGGGAGIGRIACLTLAQAGGRVAVTDLNAHAAAKVADEITAAGGKARSFALDVADEQAIVRLVGEVAKAFGRLDILVNNAGITKRQPVVDFASEDWRRVLDVNLTAPFIASREAGRHMIAGGGGRIVNVASIMGLVGGGLFPSIAYHSAKGALVNFTRALAVEWAPHGVRVNALAPTFVKTDFTRKLRDDAAMASAVESRTPMGRFAEPEEMAGGILYLASPASSMVTGHILAIDGGWLAV